MPQFTNPPPMIRERDSWKPTEADGPKSKPGKSGMPTIDRSDLPVGSVSSARRPIWSPLLTARGAAATSCVSEADARGVPLVRRIGPPPRKPVTNSRSQPIVS
jgi:hypothetical protein